jgi:Na+(H+)/acetate symporter ActP
MEIMEKVINILFLVLGILTACDISKDIVQAYRQRRLRVAGAAKTKAYSIVLGVGVYVAVNSMMRHLFDWPTPIGVVFGVIMGMIFFVSHIALPKTEDAK